ncbi:MAG: PhzA/PhzB family protein [Pseudomonadales bacterium]|nr:PhzA/PhzB family protein [Pseudomonadales bacterium]MCP5171081.1 PhzA/PhzB family protein [Pseudomonadales bacterium]MCP5301680.1 PhzA/PhzB family protein [Pseudomonadales bacterium]
MSQDAEALRKSNILLATKVLEDFGRNMDGWYDNLHENVIMEFPYGPSIGMPDRAEGKAACSGVFQFADQFLRVKFYDIRIQGLADPNKLIVECKGHGTPDAGDYHQQYVFLQEYRDGKLFSTKEYFNTKVVIDLLGDLSPLFS